MKRSLMSVAIILLFSVSVWSQSVAEGVAAPKEANEVMSTIAKWADAVRDRNQKTLDELFDETLIVTMADGTTRGKKEEIELLKPNPNSRFISIKNEDVKLRIFGQTAVATALTKMQMQNNGKDLSTAFRYTAVFVDKDGRWQLAALHTSSPLKPVN